MPGIILYTERRAAQKLCRLSLIVFFAIFLTGCTCRNNHGSDAEAELTEEQEVAVILDSRPQFDPQQMHEYALLTERTDLTPAQFAGMTAMSESALNKIEAQLEELLRNEDAADSHAVLTEWATTQWTSDFATVIAYLRRTPAPPDIQPRVETLVKASGRINTLITQIEQTQLRGKKTGLLL